MKPFGPMQLIVCGILLVGGHSWAQEAKIHQGFLFFSAPSYTMDEKEFGVYENGKEYKRIIKDNREASALFQSYRTWHKTSLWFTGFALAGATFAGAYYIFEKDMSEALGNNAGMISLGVAGGLLAVGLVCEFISWGSLSESATVYNKGLMSDDGTGAWKLPLVVPAFFVSQNSFHAGLVFSF